jgi:hypothetical protein
MTTVLIILGVSAAIFFLMSLFSGEGLKESLGAGLGGAFYGGACIIQLLIPVFVLLIGLWLFGAIFF